tara:strand:+ start:941 stop:1168 length:228 start_codon:yes stop_codon:yes gene_type:complete
MNRKQNSFFKNSPYVGNFQYSTRIPITPNSPMLSSLLNVYIIKVDKSTQTNFESNKSVGVQTYLDLQIQENYFGK